jgi:hypothetical protein
MVGVSGKDKNGTRVPIGFWSQLWKGAKLHYTLIEKWLEAVYATLIAIGPLMGKQEVKV